MTKANQKQAIAAAEVQANQAIRTPCLSQGQPRQLKKASPAKSIRVLIADDHPVVREGLISYLGCCERLVVVGEAADGLEAIAKAKRLLPDVLLMDSGMPQV